MTSAFGVSLSMAAKIAMKMGGRPAFAGRDGALRRPGIFWKACRAFDGRWWDGALRRPGLRENADRVFDGRRSAASLPSS